jgi:Xaa-Pro aminopeptidase
LGALLCFDQHNIRYITSTVIGEWARDKLTRYALLTGNGDPYVWDFGSAAKHHRLHAPWLAHDHCRAGLLGLSGAVGGDGELFRTAAREIKSLVDSEGVGDMPLGLDVVEPPMMLELQKLEIEVRDGQQTLLAAREVKSIYELVLLNMAAAMVDGVYQDIAEALKPGVRESEIAALATARLYAMGSDCVEAINAISGERCSREQNYFEIATQMNAICAEPGDCDEYTTWTMAAHAGDGVNDLKTDVAMTSGSAADGCATPQGGKGTATVKE